MKSRLRGWRLLLFAGCEHATLAESDEWDGPIERDRWWASRLHRLACRPCRGRRRVMEWLRRRLEEAPTLVRERQLQAAQAGLSHATAERIRVKLAEARQKELHDFL